MQSFTLPEEKLNELAQTVSTRLFERHYFEKDQINGEALKSFAPHNQVNRFLIFQVFQVWEMQLNKLNHPYFDLKHEDIAQTIQTLKNQISRHILISKDDFQPMLKRAVYNNLRLLLYPKETFESFFFAQNDTLPLETYDRYAQFFSDMDFVVNNIQKYHHKKELDTVEKSIFFEKMDKVAKLLTKKGGQPLDAYCAQQFKALTGQEMSNFLQEAEKEIEAAKEAEKREQEEAERKARLEAQQAEEAARKKEAELKAKEEAERREAEEAARRKAEEEAKAKAEAERQKKSFFDNLPSDNGSSLDLDLEDLDEEGDTEEETSAPEIAAEAPKEEVVAPPVVEEPKVEPSPEPVVAAEPTPPTPEEVPVAETSKESTQEFLDRFLTERQQKQEEKQPEPEVTEPETPASPVSTEPTPPANTVLAQNNQGDEDKPKSVLDRINERPQTVADRFTKQNSAPLAETLNGNRRIKLDEIPIHKQYQYVQKVFEGNNVRFRIIVDKVNNASNKDEVEDILNKFVFNNDQLDRSDSVVTEFIELLRNRF